jgi:hypothetical protein
MSIAPISNRKSDSRKVLLLSTEESSGHLAASSVGKHGVFRTVRKWREDMRMMVILSLGVFGIVLYFVDRSIRPSEHYAHHSPPSVNDFTARESQETNPPLARIDKETAKETAEVPIAQKAKANSRKQSTRALTQTKESPKNTLASVVNPKSAAPEARKSEEAQNYQVVPPQDLAPYESHHAFEITSQRAQQTLCDEDGCAEIHPQVLGVVINLGLESNTQKSNPGNGKIKWGHVNHRTPLVYYEK